VTGRGGGAAPQGATSPFPVLPGPGARTHRARRRVRLGDVRPSGRARLDAVVRYLQDVAADDVREAGAEGEYRWVVRRTRLEIVARPRYEEPVELVTWCSGTGAAWAERRTSITGERGPLVEASSVWVSLDPVSNRPCPLGGRFMNLYGTATGGRTVRSRLLHPGPPDDGVERRDWPLRDADFDVLGHVNNAVAWAVVDEELLRRAPGRRVGAAEVEYRAPVETADHLEVRSVGTPDELRVWLVDPSGQPAVSALASFD
jgi:acyl-ACP thioesterase